MTRSSWVIGGALTVFLGTLVGVATMPRTEAQTNAPSGAPAAAQRPPARTYTDPSTASLAFRSAVDAPPPGWQGPVFKLSHDYPKAKPDCSDAPWLKRNVSFTNPKPEWKDWEAYVQDIVNYVKAGQDPNLANGWNIKVGNETRWFHVPWMAYDGQRGREFVHGLTNELSTARDTFLPVGRGSGKHTLMGAKATENSPLYETWSVGMYNPCGAWSLGQAFPASGEPAVYTENGKNFARGLPFPEGTVVMKILNTTADASAVPYMKGSTNWQANAHRQISPTEYATCDRTVRTVHLVQIDLAVVDSRSPTRWVYSTLAYDGTLKGATIWDRLRPLGVQYGNDPQSFPAVPQDKSQPLRETVLAPINLPEHYGCQKRLAGVVDQANSSCMSCHMGAFASAPPSLNLQGTNIPAIFAFCGLCTDFNEQNAQYFSNYKYPQTFPGGGFPKAIPLDSSLQLAVAFAEYATHKNPTALPSTCPDAGSIGSAAAAQ